MTTPRYQLNLERRTAFATSLCGILIHARTNEIACTWWTTMGSGRKGSNHEPLDRLVRFSFLSCFLIEGIMDLTPERFCITQTLHNSASPRPLPAMALAKPQVTSDDPDPGLHPSNSKWLGSGMSVIRLDVKLAEWFYTEACRCSQA